MSMPVALRARLVEEYEIPPLRRRQGRLQPLRMRTIDEIQNAAADPQRNREGKFRLDVEPPRAGELQPLPQHARGQGRIDANAEQADARKALHVSEAAAVVEKPAAGRLGERGVNDRTGDGAAEELRLRV